MDADLQGQVASHAAEVYETFFVPALFAPWAPRVADAARLAPGEKVLDVACGTGVLAREAALRVAPGGAVTGLDRNEGMLAVARRMTPGLDWRSGVAEALPFPDRAFDAVVSQFGLMFFADRVKALGEMWRVLAPGGWLALAVWDALEHSPGYAAMVALLQRLFGEPVASELRGPFVLGDTAELCALLAAAGIPDAEIRTLDGTVRFPSLESWVHTDIKGWTLADRIDDAQYRTLQAEAPRELGPFVGRDGVVTFKAPAHIATARKR